MVWIDRPLLQYNGLLRPGRDGITELESVHSAICIATVPMMRFISKPPGNMQRSNVYQQNIEMGRYSLTVEKTTLMRMIMVMRRRRAASFVGPC